MGLIRKNGNKLYISSREEIFILDMESGIDEHIKLPELKTETKIMKLSAEITPRSITSIEFSNCGQYMAIATENKWVVIYDKNFQVIKTFMANRTASKVYFTSKNDILVADKSGNIYLYEDKSDDKGVLLLGHRSVLLDSLLTKCGKFIITCDRDEKIRVSHYPNCYNIVSFCLGHAEFVTKIKFLTEKVLVSASGDGTVRFWDFLEGKEINIIDTNSYIDDKDLLQKFATDLDKTEIIALPVSDMDLYFNDKTYLAVSIGGCDLIQLYQIDLENFSFTYLTKFIIGESFQFCLSDKLYVFSTKVLVFTYLNQDYVNEDSEILEKFNEKYKDLIQHSDDNCLNLLYKRKYDNVQEYFKRKKQRTELK